MGITVKKKKLTVKTLKAQKSDAAASETSESKIGAPDISAPESTADAGIPTAAPPAAAAPAIKPASYTLAGTLAIIAVIMFVTLIVMQSLEWTFFKDAFPRPMPPGASPSTSVMTPTSSTAPMPLEPQPLDALAE